MFASALDASAASLGELCGFTTAPVLAMPRLLLFDDDPIFVRSMERTARHHDVALKSIHCLEDLCRVSSFEFDLAILDFDLGGVTGVELADYVSSYAGDIGILMVSYTRREPPPQGRWPRAIKRFVLKDKGPLGILEAAIEVYNQQPRGR